MLAIIIWPLASVWQMLKIWNTTLESNVGGSNAKAAKVNGNFHFPELMLKKKDDNGRLENLMNLVST